MATATNKSGARECAAGILGLGLAYGGLALHVRLIADFFYLWAWGGWFLLADGGNRLLFGRSPWSDSPRGTLTLALVSIPWWLFFELLNFRLRNWAYEGLPEPLVIRWCGYAVSFATVLPAIEEGRYFIEGFLPRGPAVSPRREVRRRWLGTAQACGVLFLALPMAWPRLFFPLVWGGVFLILEPALMREAPERSWLFRWLQGERRAGAALLGAGLLCGFFWELFNYWASVKWVYTIPWPRGPKIFEMPWLGYVGFMPFALECESFRQWMDLRVSRASSSARAAWAAGLALFCLAVFAAMDRTTVRSFSSARF